jgi:hypothetical protein
MKRIIVFSLLALSVTTICSGQSNTTESLSITTYFPAPYGVYRYLRLSPTDVVPSAPALSPGVMFYNNSSDLIQYRNIAGAWVNLGGGGGGGGVGWAYNSTTQALNNTNTNGYVVIKGAAAGGEVLEVNGDVRIRDTFSTSLYVTRNSAANESWLVYDTNGTSDKYRVGISGNPSRFIIDNGTQEFFTVNNSGNVGIGVSNPQYKLHIAGSGTSPQTLAKLEGDGTVQLWIKSASPQSHDEPEIITHRARGSLTGGLSAVRQDDALLSLRGHGYTGSVAGGYKEAARIQVNADGDFSTTSTPGRISFWTTPVNEVAPRERMVIKNDGKIAIGTNGAGRTPNPDPLAMFQVFTNPTCTVYGYVKVSDGSWWSTSDKRLKKNITGIEDALKKIARVHGVRYDFITEPSSGAKKGRHLGFIGQDLEKEFPEVVSTDSRGYKSVAYGSMTPVLVEAIKEQQIQIESLRKELEELKAGK